MNTFSIKGVEQRELSHLHPHAGFSERRAEEVSLFTYTTRADVKPTRDIIERRLCAGGRSARNKNFFKSNIFSVSHFHFGTSFVTGESYKQVRIGQLITEIGSITMAVAYRTKMTISPTQTGRDNAIMLKSDHFLKDLSPKHLRYQNYNKKK